MVESSEIETVRSLDTVINVLSKCLVNVLGNGVASGKDKSSYTEDELKTLVAGKMTNLIKKDD